MILVENWETRRSSADCPVPAGAVSDATFHLWVQPPVREKTETFTADICVLDQFGNQHWLKKVEFVYS